MGRVFDRCNNLLHGWVVLFTFLDDLAAIYLDRKLAPVAIDQLDIETGLHTQSCRQTGGF